MPELPEVETIKMDLEKTVVGAMISGFSSNSPQQIIPSADAVKKAVVGAKIAGVERRAKLILIQITENRKQIAKNTSVFLGIHLKMTGRVLLRKKGDPPDPYTRAIFTMQKNTNVRHSGDPAFGGGLQNRFWTRCWASQHDGQNDEERELELRFCDTRKFGYIRLFKNKEELDKFLADFGPEPFSQDFTSGYLQKVFSNKSANIKTCLMDQRLISGMGNIYANEALFLTKILPTRSARSLKSEEFQSLKESIITVLKKGIAYRGSSAKDESYRDLQGELGHYQNHFLVYQRQKCQKCQSVIKYQKILGRGTFWCPGCQK